MKVKKENGKYYFNDLDIEEVLANRKYVLYCIDTEINKLEFMKENGVLEEKYKIKLDTLLNIKSKFKLRQ